MQYTIEKYKSLIAKRLRYGIDLKRSKKAFWIWLAGGILGIAILGYFIVAMPTRLPDVTILKDKPIVWNGLASTARRSDVFEPYEIIEYLWNEPYANTKAELGRELATKGFLVSTETGTYIEWIYGDLEVALYAARPSPGLQVIFEPDPNWSTVIVWRVLDNGLLTQFRMWLFDSRKD